MNSPPPFSGVDEPSATFEWANLLDFTLEDQFDIRWSPDNQTPSTLGLESVSVSEEALNRGSDGSDKIRKRDPRLSCENFLAGRIPCSCPEVDDKEEEEVRAVGKRIRKPAVCQVPGCQVDISELKGYHKRHRVCLRCATATSVLLDAQYMRYCQQCGKFHILPDFDEGKRSCRRKLERHNTRRRRKPTEFKVAVENGTQIDQEDIACEDKAEKDETLNESEDGNVSPLSSQPDSQSIQSGNVKSFVTFGETRIEGAQDNSKYSASTDNKNAYSSVCPTGRISFKLYDWNPAEFPRRLRHQIFQWLANMPVELEGYIRPGCTILTVFIAMPHFMWDKLSEDAARHIHNFVNAPKSMLFGRDSMTIYLNDKIFHSLKGRTSLLNIKTEVLAPRLHYVQPSCFESGKPMEFVACGSNLPRSRFRFLVSFAGRYLAYEYCHAISCGCTGLFFGNEEDNARNSEHQMYKIYISSTDPALSGPAFVEVENESGISNFIPIFFGDKHICSEIQIVQQRLVDALFSKENKNGKLGATSESCNDSVFRQAAISELLLDIGWLLKEPKSDDMQSHLTLVQIQRFNYLLKFLIQNESTIVLEKILDSLSIVMDAKQFDNQDNVTGDAAMRLFQKNVQHARTIVHQRLHERGEQILRSASSMESMDYLSIYDGENDMLSSRSTSEDIEKANKTNLRSVNTVFQQNSEAAPLLNKEVVMNLTNGSHPGKVWPPKTCTRFLSTSIMSSRSLFLTVAVVMCFGICAVVVHPKKVGEFAVVIHRCLFGSSKT